MNAHLTNLGDKTLKNLNVQLKSLDTYCIRPLEPGTDLPELPPGEERVRRFGVLVQGTNQVYISLDGQRDGAPSGSAWEPSI